MRRRDGDVPASKAEDADPPAESARRPVLPRWATFGLLPFTLALILSMTASAFLYVRSQSAAGTLSPQVQLMGLSDMSGKPAPDFRLTNQHGRPVALSAFRGRAVLLAFIDSHCTEVCPVLAQEFLLAQRDLGTAAARVAFVGVNVDPMGMSVAAVERFSALHGLTQLPNWSFMTGPTAALAGVWKAYGIEVVVPKGANQTVHADYLYFLDPEGRERYLAVPQVDRRANGVGYLPQPTLAQWGRGIADYLRRALSR